MNWILRHFNEPSLDRPLWGLPWLGWEKLITSILIIPWSNGLVNSTFEKKIPITAHKSTLFFKCHKMEKRNVFYTNVYTLWWSLALGHSLLHVYYLYLFFVCKIIYKGSLQHEFCVTQISCMKKCMYVKILLVIKIPGFSIFDTNKSTNWVEILELE